MKNIDQFFSNVKKNSLIKITYTDDPYPETTLVYNVDIYNKEKAVMISGFDMDAGCINSHEILFFNDPIVESIEVIEVVKEEDIQGLLDKTIKEFYDKED